MTGARSSKKGDTLDLTCADGAVSFVTLGRESSADAVVAAAGQARIPLAIIGRIAELAESFHKTPVRIRLEPGKIRVQSASITEPGIRIGKIKERSIDIPDDAPILDLLSVHMLFSAQQIKESDLSTRIMAAEKQRSADLGRATEALAKYGVTGASLENALNEAIARHRDTLRPILKPEIAGV